MEKTTNDLKKGDRVLLAYGEQNGDLASCGTFIRWLQLDFNNSSYKSWEGTIADNRHGNIRMVDVRGWETEIGSVYAHDIIAWFDDTQGTWQPIKHTEKQLQLNEQIRELEL